MTVIILGAILFLGTAALMLYGRMLHNRRWKRRMELLDEMIHQAELDEAINDEITKWWESKT